MAYSTTSLMFKGTLVRRHVDQIRPVGIKCKKISFPRMHQRFPSSEVRENNSNIQHAETAEDISKDRNEGIGFIFRTRSAINWMLRFQIYHSLQLRETDSETRSPPVPDRPFPRAFRENQAASGETCFL
ncbi:hypothetical protein TNCV_658791 [Trichonephila clavipes]|nr:hypothetical protein TNCV_658791 [Trichonephila clavipes]